MIPFFEIPALRLGPLELQPFGLLVAIGIWVGARLAVRRARQEKLDVGVLSRFFTWGVVGGVLGGHLVHLFAYHPEELIADPWKIVRVWDGLSSFGGLMGGVVASWFFFRREGTSIRPFGDALALGVAPGWGVARIGCFVAHDHPGTLTDFPLAVAFPGGARHDLGLYDALLLFALTAVVYALRNREALRGRLLAVLGVGYGLGRFGFDFLRATDLPYVDARYFGLTPAQYGCIVLVAWGLWRLAPLLRAGGGQKTPGGKTPGRIEPVRAS